MAAVMRGSRCAFGSDVPAAASTTESEGRQPDSTSRSATMRAIAGDAEGRSQHGVAMSAGLDVRGEVGAHVVAAGEKCRDQHGWNVVGQSAKHFTRGRAEHVDVG